MAKVWLALRAAAVLAAVALGALPAAASPRATVLGGPWISGGSELSAYDARTLRPLGPRLRLGVAAWPWARSPDGSRVALVSGDNGSWTSGVVVVDARAVRPIARIRLAGLYAVGGFWPRPDRLLVLGRTRDGSGTLLALVDPLAPRELARTQVGGSLLVARGTSAGAALLLGPAAGIGPARLLTVDGDLALRTVSLDAVSAGRELPPADPADEEATMVLRSPGLAVDRAGNRAFVVGEGEPVAEVDLASGAVSYHPLALRAPARAEKSISGPTLSAAWLGNGLLAVTGTVYGGIDASTHVVRQTPVGLRIVDTGTWSVRTSDPAVSWIVRSGPWLVATPSAGGLRWFDLQGTPRGQLFGARRVGERALLGSRMLVRVDAEPRTLLVDLAAGRVVGTAPPPDPSLPGFFVGDGSILG